MINGYKKKKPHYINKMSVGMKSKKSCHAGSEGAGVFTATQVLLLLITWLKDFPAGTAFFLSESERPGLLVGCINSK